MRVIIITTAETECKDLSEIWHREEEEEEEEERKKEDEVTNPAEEQQLLQQQEHPQSSSRQLKRLRVFRALKLISMWREPQTKLKLK